MTDRELAVCRGIACTEARAAEALTHNRPGGNQVKCPAVLDQSRHGRHRARIDIQAECTVAAALSSEDIRRCTDVVKGTTGASGDLALFYPDTAVMVLGEEIHLYTLELFVGVFLYEMENILRILLHLVDGVRVARMHRHGDRAFDSGEINIHTAVIICHFCRIELFVCFRSAVRDKVSLRLFIRYPDGGPAGRLRGHDINRVAVFDREAGNAGADEFHHLVLYIAILIDSSDDAQRHVLRANAGLR